MSRLTKVATARSPIWWAVLAVALCGVVATAHGLFEVVAACGVLAFVAALYVPITDGLALVAYAATDRLRGAGRLYAWAVVLLAAGLSGLAQAVYLGGLGEPPPWLRYVVGAWPAIAVAIAAHLLYLVGRPADEPAHEQAHGEADQVARDAPAREPVAHAGVTHASIAEVAHDASAEVAHEPVRPVRHEPAVVTRLAAVPAMARASRRTMSRPAGKTTVLCDAGCGRQVSRSTRTRHRSKGCHEVAA